LTAQKNATSYLQKASQCLSTACHHPAGNPGCILNKTRGKKEVLSGTKAVAYVEEL